MRLCDKLYHGKETIALVAATSSAVKTDRLDRGNRFVRTTTFHFFIFLNMDLQQSISDRKYMILANLRMFCVMPDTPKLSF